MPIRAYTRPGPDVIDVVLIYPSRNGAPAMVPGDLLFVGPDVPPTDVDTTGSSPGAGELPMGEEAED